jgi:Tfp pilus assembly protein PilO
MNKNISALILIIISIGIYFTVTSGMLDEARAVKKINDQYSSALDSAAKLVAARDNLNAQYVAISQEDRDKLDKMIPSTVDNIRLIMDMNKIAIKNGFSISDMKAVTATSPARPGAGASHPPILSDGSTNNLTAASFADPVLDTINVTFTASATYDQFRDFLKDIESNLRIMNVTKLSVTSSENNLYAFQVQLQTYWLRQ